MQEAMLMAQSAVARVIDGQLQLLAVDVDTCDDDYAEKDETHMRNVLLKKNAKRLPFELSDAVKIKMLTMGFKSTYDCLLQHVVGSKAEAEKRRKINKEDRKQIEGKARASLSQLVENDDELKTEHVVIKNMAVDYVLNSAMRLLLLKGHRMDARSVQQLRDVQCVVDKLPAAHGSSFFKRGDTHVLCATTLASKNEHKLTLSLNGSNIEKKDYFFLHYDFPPYCTGETGNSTAISRRMLGHGNLAEKALKPVMPSVDQFPYAIRVFAECTSSNGSSSMASVCGASLALMDAGVPIKAATAGVSIGLVTASCDDFSFLSHFLETENNNNNSDELNVHNQDKLISKTRFERGDKYVLVGDITGSEDHHGDMDFKIAGTKNGITAIQLDIKVNGGISLPILNEALLVAKNLRLEILEKMQETIANANENLKPHTPKAVLIHIDKDRRKYIIGFFLLLLFACFTFFFLCRYFYN
jgi:polyribonucleotide nucleotidyltransferase